MIEKSVDAPAGLRTLTYEEGTTLNNALCNYCQVTAGSRLALTR